MDASRRSLDENGGRRWSEDEGDDLNTGAGGRDCVSQLGWRAGGLRQAGDGGALHAQGAGRWYTMRTGWNGSAVGLSPSAKIWAR